MSDLVVKVYDKKGIMSPPHKTTTELKAHLEQLFSLEKYQMMGTSAHFCCVKQ